MEIEDGGTVRIFFHEREIWWCSIGLNIGSEQDGKGDWFARPVLVFKKFNKEIFWAIPLSTTLKEGMFYENVDLKDNIPRVALLSQLRLIDAKRLLDMMGCIDKECYIKIQKAVIKLCTI